MPSPTIDTFSDLVAFIRNAQGEIFRDEAKQIARSICLDEHPRWGSDWGEFLTADLLDRGRIRVSNGQTFPGIMFRSYYDILPWVHCRFPFLSLDEIYAAGRRIAADPAFRFNEPLDEFFATRTVT